MMTKAGVGYSGIDLSYGIHLNLHAYVNTLRRHIALNLSEVNLGLN